MGAKYVIDENTLKGIADVVREKTGKTDPIPVTKIKDEIEGVVDASVADILNKRTDLVVTENGEYVPEGDSTGFKSVKVELTELPEVERKTVSFVDYDGAILHTYSADEVKAMTEMPPLPSHDGLICQGWNWTLDEIKQYIADFEEDNRHLYPFDVGAIYITDDGKYRFVLNIDCEDGVEFGISFVFNTGSSYGSLNVDWGDGSEVDSFWLRGYGYPKHTYAKSGRYTVSLTSIGYVTSLFDPNGNACSLEEVYLGGTSNIKASLFAKQRGLKIVTIPNSVTEIGEKAFSFCTGLKHINLPDGIATLGASAFASSGVKRLTLPSKIQTMGGSIVSPGASDDYTGLTEHITFRSPTLASAVARNLATLKEVNLAKTTKTIPTYAFDFAHSMRRFYVPSDIESIGDQALYVQLRLIDCTACRNIPTITNYSLSNQRNPVIRVPLHKLEEWKSATNWSDRASLMVGIEVPWANE